MENNPDRFSVIARSRKQVARPHASSARCDPPISARRSPSSRHLAPINAQESEDYGRRVKGHASSIVHVTRRRHPRMSSGHVSKLCKVLDFASEWVSKLGNRLQTAQDQRRKPAVSLRLSGFGFTAGVRSWATPSFAAVAAEGQQKKVISEILTDGRRLINAMSVKLIRAISRRRHRADCGGSSVRERAIEDKIRINLRVQEIPACSEKVSR
ncbi:hypothetical protein EVAR_65030_1 [Eumeta japonica]|uniref:Uncharacterized protein n=1 Tax=Eumeta variegata TaxID=151549 RepID=A0A4C1YUL9_EUMVA|nr:hypothetical protein EVAR_65030_1 [Eumeta japonica]